MSQPRLDVGPQADLCCISGHYVRKHCRENCVWLVFLPYPKQNDKSGRKSTITAADRDTEGQPAGTLPTATNTVRTVVIRNVDGRAIVSCVCGHVNVALFL